MQISKLSTDIPKFDVSNTYSLVSTSAHFLTVQYRRVKVLQDTGSQLTASFLLLMLHHRAAGLGLESPQPFSLNRLLITEQCGILRIRTHFPSISQSQLTRIRTFLLKVPSVKLASRLSFHLYLMSLSRTVYSWKIWGEVFCRKTFAAVRLQCRCFVTFRGKAVNVRFHTLNVYWTAHIRLVCLRVQRLLMMIGRPLNAAELFKPKQTRANQDRLVLWQWCHLSRS